MRWREWITEGYSTRAHEQRPEFREGASPERLTVLESQLGCHLPAALRELLQETDGVRESLCHGGTWFGIYTPVWSCDDIVEQNRKIRSDPEGPPPPADAGVVPLYFADAGVDGILFAFLVGTSGNEDPAVYGYYPIGREWRRVSPSLAVHLHGWNV